MSRKVVIVTGSRRGLGKEIAHKFASKGYDIVLNDKEDFESLVKVENNIKNKYQVEVLSLLLDISKEENVKRLLK